MEVEEVWELYRRLDEELRKALRKKWYDRDELWDIRSRIEDLLGEIEGMQGHDEDEKWELSYLRDELRWMLECVESALAEC